MSYTATLGVAITVGTITVQNGTWAIALGANTLTLNSGTNWTLGGTGFGAISGTGGITKSGTNTIILSGANTYTGVTTINAGTLSITTITNGGGGASNIGNATNAAGSVVLNGGTLQYTGAGNSTNRLFTVNSAGGTIDASGSGALNFTNTGSLAGTGALTLTGTSTGANTLAAKMTGATALTKTGSGTWVLSSATSSRTGVTTISGGTLSISSMANGGNNSAIGAATNAAANIVLDGGTLQYTGAAANSNRLFTLTNNGGTLDGSGATNAALNFTNTGSIAMNGTGNRTLTLTGTSTGANTIAAVIANPSSGATSLTKTGAGTWVVSGANTYTGVTTVNTGVLQAGSTSAFGNNSAVTLANNAGVTLALNSNSVAIGSLTGGGTTGGNVTLGTGTLTVGGDNTSPGAYAGVISGTGGLTKAGTGTLTLSGANSYTGVTTINGGTLSVSTIANGNSNSALGAANNNSGRIVLNGGTLQYTGAGNSTNRLFTVNSAGGTLDASGTGALNFTNTGALAGTGALTLTGTNTGANTLAAQMTGATALTKTGVGTWVLSRATSSRTGVTTVSGGTLSVSSIANGGSNSAIGAANNNASQLVLDGGTLQYTGAGNSTNRLFTLTNNGGTLDASGASNAALNFTNSGSIAFSGTGTRTLTLTGTSTGANTLAGVLGDGSGGATSLTKTGAGTWVLSGTNTYTGATTVSAGILRAGSTAAFGNNSAVTLANIAGATLDLNNTNVSIGSVTGGGTTGGNITLGTGTLTAGGDNTSPAAYAGVISGTGGLTKTGTGTMTLSGTNTYTGVTTVSGGTLSVNTLANGGTNSALGAANNNASQLVLNGGTLQYTGAAANSNRLFTLTNNGGTLDASGASNAALNLTNTGSIAFSGSGTRTLTLTGTSTGANTLAGVLGNGSGGATSLTKTGAGTWVVSGANTYTGVTTVNTGVLQAGSTSAFGNNSAVTLANNAGVTLALNSNSVAIGSLTGGGTTGGNVTLGTGTLTVGGDNTSPGAYAGVISGTGGLTKTGTGTMTLSGTNTYSGVTTVNAGTLQVSGTNAIANSNVTVNAVGGGTATFAVAAGSSQAIGSLTFGGVGGAATSTNAVTLGDASSTLTLGGTVTYDATGNPLGSTISTVSGTGTLGLGSSVRTFNVADSSNAASDLTVSANISGTGQSSGGLTKTGAGTLTLSGGSNTFNGLVAVSAGTLAANGTTSDGGFAELGDHSWVTNVNGPLTVITVNSGATLSVNSTETAGDGDGTTHQYETLSLSGSGVGGAGALNATGGINTWWGNITLAGDTTIQNSAVTGGANTLYLGPLQYSSAPTTFALNGHALTLTGAGDIQISNSIGNSGGDTGSVEINLSNPNAVVYYNGIQNFYTGQTKVDQGTLLLLVSPGSHPNAAVLGNLVIGDGSGAADSATVQEYDSDQIADTATVTINADGRLDLGTYGVDETVGALTLNGGHILTDVSSQYGNLYLGGAVHVTANSVIDGDAVSGGVIINANTFTVDTGATLTVNAVVGGNGGFVKDGLGTMVLTRDNDNVSAYSGVTEVKNGILNIQNSGALGQNGGGDSAKGTVVDSGATLQLQNNGSNIAVGAETLNLSGTGYTSLGALESVTGTNSWAGLVTLNADSTVNTAAGSLNLSGQVTGSATVGNTQTLTVTGAGDTTISSRIFDNRVDAGTDSHTSGALALTKNGSGTLTLSNSNSFTGAVNVNAGTLNVTANDGFGYDLHNNTVSVQSGATLGFTTASTSNTIAQLTNTNASTGTAGGVVNIVSGATLVVNPSSQDYYGGTLSGSGLFEKEGHGTFTFTSAANTSAFNFAGTVQLNATSTTDTLEFQGGTGSGITSTNALYIGTLNLTGGTLKLSDAYINVGTLDITGNTIIDFGTVGASVLNATNIYIAAGVTVTIENWTSETDFLFATNVGYATSGGFRLVDGSGTLASFNQIGVTPENQIDFQGDPQSPDGSHTTWINYGYDGFTNWEIRPIPEPATYGAILLGVSAALFVWKRRRDGRGKAAAPTTA